MGAGVTGGYFGGRLAQAERDVSFLVRPAPASHLRERGLQIVSPHGDVTLQPRLVLANGVRDPSDVVLLAVKSFAFGAAVEDVAPTIGARIGARVKGDHSTHRTYSDVICGSQTSPRTSSSGAGIYQRAGFGRVGLAVKNSYWTRSNSCPQDLEEDVPAALCSLTRVWLRYVAVAGSLLDRGFSFDDSRYDALRARLGCHDKPPGQATEDDGPFIDFFR
nr:2-dehydropantoate 2-reductase N-terminal domain-containing protein [uncultured Lichenicoccus sp.]